MQHTLRNKKLLPLLLTVLALASGCSTPPTVSPPVVVKESEIPKLSDELKREPKPSGSYWAAVTQWRKDWEAVLKTLQLK